MENEKKLNREEQVELSTEEKEDIDASYGTFQDQFFDQSAEFKNEEILNHILQAYRTQPDSVSQLDHYAPDGKMVVQLYNVILTGDTTRTETIDWFYVNVKNGEYISVFFGHTGSVGKD